VLYLRAFKLEIKTSMICKKELSILSHLACLYEMTVKDVPNIKCFKIMHNVRIYTLEKNINNTELNGREIENEILFIKSNN